MTTRRDLAKLSASEFQTFVDALQKTKQNGVYDKFVELHYAARLEIHQKPMFLPWHRAFLADFEAALRTASGDPTIAIPYWDWTVENSASGKPWTHDMLGGSGDPVSMGPFASWPISAPREATYKKPKLWRALGAANRGVTLNDVLRLFKNMTFDGFWTALESGPHNTMHNWVGGLMETIEISVNDPVFWLHHANIDRIWAQWQEMYPNLPAQVSAGSMGPGGVGQYAAMDGESIMPPSSPDSAGRRVGDVTKPFYYDAFYKMTLRWSDESPFPNQSNTIGTSGGAALAVLGNRLYCLHQGRGLDGWVWQTSTVDGLNWVTDKKIPDGKPTFGMSSAPALASYKDQLFLAIQGRNNDGWTYLAKPEPSTATSAAPERPWLPPYDKLKTQNGGLCGVSGSPALCEFNGKLHYVHEGRSSDGWTWWSCWDGGQWSQDQLIPSSDHAYGLSGGAALCVSGGKMHCARAGRGNDGSLWCSSYDGSIWSGDSQITAIQSNHDLAAPPALCSFGGSLICVYNYGTEKMFAGPFETSNIPTYMDAGHIGIVSTCDAGQTWIEDDGLTSRCSGRPALIAFDGKLFLIFEGQKDCGWLWYRTASPILPD